MFCINLKYYYTVVEIVTYQAMEFVPERNSWNGQNILA